MSGLHAATLYNLTGIGGFELDEDGGVTGGDESDTGGEQAHEQEVFGSLGFIGRPLPPDGDLFAEAIAVRTDDGLIAHAFRDLRLHRAVNPGGGATTPREGQLMFAGYGGAFLSHAMAPGGGANVSTWYLPYAFVGGVPTKAHAITLDPSDGGSVSVVHGDGIFFTLSHDTGAGPGIVASIGSETFLRMTAGEFSVSAAKILLKGNVYLGRQAELGVSLLGGPITPPSPSVFVSPV